MFQRGHNFKVVLVEPEIPQNAGNVARLCAATNAALHLVRPLGFFITEKHFKRAGMDYLKDVEMTLHNDLSTLLKVVEADGGALVLTSGLAQWSAAPAHWNFKFQRGSWIVFGKESAGLPAPLLAQHPQAVVQVPMAPGTRGLNLSTAAGIVVYEALRQLEQTGKV